jgi:ABC-2 type transport system permease protein
MEQPVLASLIWCAIIIGIFAPLAIRKYKAATTK